MSELNWEPYGRNADGDISSLKSTGGRWVYLVLVTPDGVTLTRWSPSSEGDARLHEALVNAVQTDRVHSGAVVDYACGMAADWDNGGIGDAILTRLNSWQHDGTVPR